MDHRKLKLFSILLIIVYGLGSSGALALAAEGATPSRPDLDQEQPDIGSYASGLSRDFGSYFSNMAGYDWYTYAAVLGTTLALLPYDQQMTDTSHDYALNHHLMNRDDHYGQFASWHILGKSVDFPYPKDTTSFFWYLGDGMFSLELMAGFACFGYFGNDPRSSATSIQIFESLLITATTVMPIKMLTGRESPLRSTVDGGKWQGYPGLTNYINHQARYYAFPSGHVATAVSTLTVIAGNYPDSAWLVPTGSVAVGLLMVALMNVGSHWPSDFPLAVMIGYTAGHTVVANHRKGQQRPEEKKIEQKQALRSVQWQGVTPSCFDAWCGLATAWRF